MDEGTPSRPKARQLLWIAAGVAVLTALVLAASWLFSPRTTAPSTIVPSSGLKEEEVQKQTFQPEAPGGATRALPTGPAQEPAQAPAAEPSAPPEQEPAPAASETPQPAPSPAPPEATSQHKAPESSAPVQGGFGVQVGAFASQGNAKDVVRRLQAAGFKSTVQQKGGKYKVVVGGYADRDSAEKALGALRRAGFNSAFVVPMEQP